MTAGGGPGRPLEVAIVGGGCGALAAAFELTRPEHRGRFTVTVYQEGWRLGGKGASGRGPAGRIEEHGLHVWLGFYENAFGLVRACYAELAAGGCTVFGKWTDALLPEPDVGLVAADDGGGWQRWSGHFPPRPGLPGDTDPPPQLHSLAGYMRAALQLMATLLLDVDVERDRVPVPPPTPDDGAERIVAALQAFVARGVFAGVAVLVEALGVLRVAIDVVPPAHHWLLVRCADVIARNLRVWLEAHVLAGDGQRHVWELADIVMATVVGFLRDRVLTDPRGLEAIDDYDVRDWLRRNGASERALSSPYIQGLYDLALAYEDGDPDKPRIAAGQGMRGGLRMFFTYRGSLFWRLRAGMGDVVFAPLYEVLRRRGVRFEFFHRLTNVALAPAESMRPGEDHHVVALDFDVQAEVRAGTAYEPLVDVAGRPCWPSRPRFEALVDGEALAARGADFESHWDRTRVRTRQLRVTHDFDFVVLGIGVGAVPYACGELVRRDPRWSRMVAEVKTVATQAFQIWLDEDLETLGWPGPARLISGFAKPFDSWCDMGHVIPAEGWRFGPGGAPRPRPATAVYFCGVLADEAVPPADDDPRYPQRRAGEVAAAAVHFLADTARPLWPRAYDASGSFRWQLLADPDAPPADRSLPAKPARFATQYWRANVNPSERYVLSLPGSLRHRISPLDRTYDNLTIAGDWTDCGFNTGCAEAAVMSGRLAAHALSGLPALADIVGYNHP